jgi:hypothetical protein
MGNGNCAASLYDNLPGKSRWKIFATPALARLVCVLYKKEDVPLIRTDEPTVSHSQQCGEAAKHCLMENYCAIWALLSPPAVSTTIKLAPPSESMAL